MKIIILIIFKVLSNHPQKNGVIEVEHKNNWLDKYAPFFLKENRNVLSKETYTGFSSAELKLDFLKRYNTNKKIILVDDDNNVLNTIDKNIDDITLFQDSELID